MIVETFKRENPGVKRYVVFAGWGGGGADAEDRLPRVTAHYGDVSDEASVEACVGEILEAHGKIDNLVTSAGFTENFEATAYPIDRVRKLWGVNVDGTYLFATAVARHLVSLPPSHPLLMVWMRRLLLFSLLLCHRGARR